MDHVLNDARSDMIVTESGSENMVHLMLNLSPCLCLQETTRYPNPVLCATQNCLPIKM